MDECDQILEDSFMVDLRDIAKSENFPDVSFLQSKFVITTFLKFVG